MAEPLEIDLAAATDIGTVRDHNEDSFLVGDLDALLPIDISANDPPRFTKTMARGPGLIVCDGMGGAEGGEVASDLAARATWRELAATSAADRDPEVVARLLRRAVRVANHDVHATAVREPGLRGMGSTLSAAAIAGDRLIAATVGDSRVYILRAGALVQVTRDQSLSSALLTAGRSAFEAQIAGGAILQALGVGEDVEPSLSIIELRRGDRILLCSDGLHGLVGDPALALLMSPPHDVAQAVKLLIAAARAAGGSDNITAIVCEVGGARLQPPANDDDLPTFREFDPQKEGDPALTDTSRVARRLAARVGIGQVSQSGIPVTGQHAVMRSSVGLRLPPTSLPVDLDDPPGPARERLRSAGGIPLWVLLSITLLACALALVAWRPLNYHPRVRVVIDHIAGTRRGQRQELPVDARIRFGRHPECEVSFDPHRDIDASSRHAELRTSPAGFVLVDLGSSNGTYVDGRRITETPIPGAVPVSVEFGSGGPRIRLFVGDQAAIDGLPPAAVDVPTRPWLPWALGAGALVIVSALLLAVC